MDLPNDQTMNREPNAALRLSRALQFVTACALLVLAFVPALSAAGLIWLVLGRPVMFNQTRSGLNGRPFNIYKLRTMHDRRDYNGKVLPDSERQTRLTRFIRAVRLDEIPQLVAILAGDLNLIGPRPLQPMTISAFGTAGVLRGKVRPGLTGWAQVNGNTRLTNTDKLALDLWYIDHRSIWLDLKILLLTARTILLGESVNQRNLAEATAYLRQRMDAPTTPALAASRLAS